MRLLSPFGPGIQQFAEGSDQDKDQNNGMKLEEKEKEKRYPEQDEYSG